MNSTLAGVAITYVCAPLKSEKQVYNICKYILFWMMSNNVQQCDPETTHECLKSIGATLFYPTYCVTYRLFLTLTDDYRDLHPQH